jgi:hypothetical protein
MNEVHAIAKRLPGMTPGRYTDLAGTLAKAA